MATEKITSHTGWPLFLPRDSQKLAEDIYEELQKKLRAHDLDKYCSPKETPSPVTQPAKKPSCCATFCCARGQKSDGSGAPSSAENV